jgi:hypothetical protein
MYLGLIEEGDRILTLTMGSWAVRLGKEGVKRLPRWRGIQLSPTQLKSRRMPGNDVFRL